MAAPEKTLETLLELGDLSTRRTRAEQVEQALRTVLLITEADAAAVLLPSSRRGERLVLHAESPAAVLVPAAAGGSAVARLFAEDCQLLALNDLSEEARWAAGDACPGVIAGPVLFAPIRQRDPGFGYLAAYRRHGRARFNSAEGRTMLLLSSWFALALEAVRMASGMAKLTVTDGLTEVYNSRFLRTALRRELRRAARFGQELSLVLVEPDQMEAVRAEQGELRAAALLRELASLLAPQVRAYDLVARAGGDSFMLVLPQTGIADATEIAERLRAAVERQAFLEGAPGAVTASFGVASFPREGADEKALAAAVERALAQARRQGSNSVYALERAA